MEKNVFIIGNGFDLDLGRKTRYSDFAQSKYWPKSDKKKCLLEKYLNGRKEKEKWFDIENELLEYTKIEGYVNQLQSNAYVPPEQTDYLYKSMMQNDISFFKEMHSQLIKYLREEEEKPINCESIAARVLNTIYASKNFDKIYSFNYTDINNVLHQIIRSNLYSSLFTPIECNHIHGKIKDDSIILGVDETKLCKGYEIFHKTRNENYRPHRIYDDLLEAKEIVIFGLSFGQIDYNYFDRFFVSQSTRTHIKEEERKHITIFTYGEEDRMSIYEKFEEMEVNIGNLFAQSEFNIIRTAQNQDESKVEEFCKRIAPHIPRFRIV